MCSQSLGPGGMHPRVLGELAGVTVEPLSTAGSQGMGGVPEDWKKASVTPVFKKGKKEDLGNFSSFNFPLKTR